MLGRGDDAGGRRAAGRIASGDGGTPPERPHPIGGKIPWPAAGGTEYTDVRTLSDAEFALGARFLDQDGSLTLHVVSLAAAAVAGFLVVESAWTLRTPRKRNLLLVLASCALYTYVDWRGLLVLLAPAAVDYRIGIALAKAVSPSRRKLLLGTTLLVNLGLLVGLKYLGFVESSVIAAGRLMGFQTSAPEMTLFVPLGLSFITLQRLSYTLDVYRGQMKPWRDPLAFAAWATFLPIIPAGPIERARRLLPQFARVRPMDASEVVWGLRRILAGMFKKIVVADSLALFVDTIFQQAPGLPASELAVGVFLFSVQIYCDFAGYSDIAIGLSRLLGFRVMENFNHPYLSRDIAEFWHRWHISLSHWFRDYVYTPLTWKVSLARRWARLGAVVLTFALSGLWHGSGARFLVWGALHGLFFAPVLFGWVPPPGGRSADAGPRLRELPWVLATFLAVTLAWIPFRAADLGAAVSYASGLASSGWLVVPRGKWLLLLAVGYMAFDIMQARRPDWFVLDRFGPALRWTAYLMVALAVLLFGHWGEARFIYTGF